MQEDARRDAEGEEEENWAVLVKCCDGENASNEKKSVENCKGADIKAVHESCVWSDLITRRWRVNT